MYGLPDLTDVRHVLLAGCGGGYDVMGALPYVAALNARGITWDLASLSFCYLNGLDGAAQDPRVPNLYEVRGDAAVANKYCPEAWLAKHLEAIGQPRPIYCFDKTGVAPLRAAYAAVLARTGADTVILIDGGIDAILRGDELSLGTPSEDLASLAAVTSLAVPRVWLACVGMTAELRDGIRHSQVFERFAALTQAGGMLGSGTILRGTPGGDQYLAALDTVETNQATMKRSHVHKLIRAAMQGVFGWHGDFTWISPLLNQAWLFDARVVAAQHLFLHQLHQTETIWHVAAVVEAMRKNLAIREISDLPI